MKRICFLITWLVTSFSLVLNTGQSQTPDLATANHFTPMVSVELQNKPEKAISPEKTGDTALIITEAAL